MPQRPADLFMQWYPVAVNLDAADTTDLGATEFTTGLSIRGDYAWLIHRVEFSMTGFVGSDTTVAVRLALSTVRQLAAMPEINDKGTICRISQVTNINGINYSRAVFLPWLWTSLPPTIIASPVLTFYADATTDVVNYRGLEIIGRIGYTTIPITKDTYLEIAETFETL